MDEYPSEHDSQQDDLPPDRVEAAIGLARHCSFISTGGVIAVAVLIGSGDSSRGGSDMLGFAMIAFTVAVFAALLTHGYAVGFGREMPLKMRPSPSSMLKWACSALLTGIVMLCIYALASVS